MTKTGDVKLPRFKVMAQCQKRGASRLKNIVNYNA